MGFHFGLLMVHKGTFQVWFYTEDAYRIKGNNLGQKYSTDCEVETNLLIEAIHVEP